MSRSAAGHEAAVAERGGVFREPVADLAFLRGRALRFWARMRAKLEALFDLIAAPLAPGADATVDDLDMAATNAGAFKDLLDRKSATVFELRVGEAADESRWRVQCGSCPVHAEYNSRIKRIETMSWELNEVTGVVVKTSRKRME